MNIAQQSSGVAGVGQRDTDRDVLAGRQHGGDCVEIGVYVGGDDFHRLKKHCILSDVTSGHPRLLTESDMNESNGPSLFERKSGLIRSGIFARMRS